MILGLPLKILLLPVVVLFTSLAFASVLSYNAHQQKSSGTDEITEETRVFKEEELESFMDEVDQGAEAGQEESITSRNSSSDRYAHSPQVAGLHDEVESVITEESSTPFPSGSSTTVKQASPSVKQASQKESNMQSVSVPAQLSTHAPSYEETYEEPTHPSRKQPVENTLLPPSNPPENNNQNTNKPPDESLILTGCDSPPPNDSRWDEIRKKWELHCL